MSYEREVGTYFKERVKVKKLMREMLKPKYGWTRKVKREFEDAWINYWFAYNEHKEKCKQYKKGA